MTGNLLRQDADAACLLAGLTHMRPRCPFPKEWPFRMGGNLTAALRPDHALIGTLAGPGARCENSHGG